MSLAFLSYTLRDGTVDRGLLEKIADSVGEPYELVYVDLLHNDSNRPQEHLEDVLRSSAALYLGQTPGALESQWVRREISLAKRMGIAVVPLDMNTWGLVERRSVAEVGWHWRRANGAFAKTWA